MMTNINGTYVFSYRDSYYMYDYNCSVILQIEETAFDTIIKHQNHQTITHDEKELIDSLYECGFLHEFNIDDQRESSEETIAYLTFAPVYNCNLRCTYCFGNHGDNFKNPKKQFDKDTLTEMLSYFFNSAFPSAKQYRIDFVSGGEPLLGFEIVKESIYYIEQYTLKTGKNVSLWLCTNGTLLTTEIIEFLSKHNVSIGISIDGRKKYNDATRVDVNGNGTYDRIIQGIKLIQGNSNVSKRFKTIWALCTATNDNCDFIDILKHIKELGIRHAQIRLVRDKEQYNVNMIIEQYSRLTDFLYDQFCEGDLTFFRMIMNDNDQFGKVLKRVFMDQLLTHRCQAGINKITICPDKTIYPCDSFVGIPDYIIGNIADGVIPNPYFRNTNVDVISKCSNCDIKYLCGGDCYYNSYIKSGATCMPDDSYCIIQRSLIHHAIVLRLKMQSSNERLYNKLCMELKYKNEYSEIFG